MVEKPSRPDVATEAPSVCRKCGSIDRKLLRSDTFPDTDHWIAGLNRIVHGVIRQYARCLGCGQTRVIWLPIMQKRKARKHKPRQKPAASAPPAAPEPDPVAETPPDSPLHPALAKKFSNR